MAKLIVPIIADPTLFKRGMKESTLAAEQFESKLRGLSVNVKASAEAQVAASVKTTMRLREEAAAYKLLASSATRGSAQQIAATNLATRAESRLALSMGVSSHESNRLRASSSGAGRELERFSRGALAGSGIFRSLGRSIAFASGGFLAFASGGAFLRASVDAARDASVVRRQEAAQLAAAGKSYAVYRGEIDKTSLRISALSGFTKTDLEGAFTTVLRSTSNVSKALRDESVVADLARARHIGLAQAALIVGKTEAGNTTLLRRQGFQIAKNATVEQAMAVLRAKTAGQARAGSTEAQRFNAILHDSEVIIGDGILPVLNQYLTKGAAWLTQMNESGRLQRDVKVAAKDFQGVVSDGVAVFHNAAAAVRGVDHVTGSFANTLKMVAGVWLVFKARAALAWAGLTTEIAAVSAAELGVAATTSTVATRVLAYTGEMAAGWDAVAASAAGAAAASGAAGGAAAAGSGASVLTRLGRFGGALVGGFALGSAGTLHKAQIINGRYVANGIDLGPAPSVAGQPVNPFAPNRFGSGDLGLGALKPAHPVTASAAAAGARGVSLMGQFNLLELRLADAQRTQNTVLQRQILVSEETIVLRLRDQASKLKDRTKFAQEAASIESQILSIDQEAAAKAKAAKAKAKDLAAKVALGGVPLVLQLAQAKADAIAAGSTTLSKGQISAAKAIRTAEFKAIKSHRLSMQGLIDAWTEIGSINSQLKNTSKGAIDTYHSESTRALTVGLNLSRDARVTLEERLAQRAAHRGYAPNGPAALGEPTGVTITGPITIHGIRNLDELYTELQKIGKRRGQRRGQR
jgi:hypothetical protein